MSITHSCDVKNAVRTLPSPKDFNIQYWRFAHIRLETFQPASVIVPDGDPMRTSNGLNLLRHPSGVLRIAKCLASSPRIVEAVAYRKGDLRTLDLRWYQNYGGCRWVWNPFSIIRFGSARTQFMLHAQLMLHSELLPSPFPTGRRRASTARVRTIGRQASEASPDGSHALNLTLSTHVSWTQASQRPFRLHDQTMKIEH
jgi:hypothetical protein